VAEVGEINVRIGADISEFQEKIRTTQSMLDDFSKNLGRLGRDLSAAFTLPLSIIGKEAIKTGMSFEDTMKKIVALTGTSQKQTDEWAKQIKKMATEVGKSPQELAEALYFIASSGIEASRAIDVLETAAKASTAGLGDTQVVTDALTSALNAYAKSGLTAKQATAVLINTVKLGKAEADELAGSIGRVVPVAAQLGVGFEEVGAAIAAMTLTGLSADEAVTALRGVLTTILQPTQQEREALAALGLSVEGVKKELSEKGLLATLNTINNAFQKAPSILQNMQAEYYKLQSAIAQAEEKLEKTKATYGENSEEAKAAAGELKYLQKEEKALAKSLDRSSILIGDGFGGFFGNVRALVGALALTGENSERVKELFSEMSQTTPAEVDKAFSTVADSAQFTLNQALATTKTALLELSQSVLPPFVEVLKSVSSIIKEVTDWFNGLDENTKKTAVTIATVFAATGPALLAISGMISTVNNLVNTFKSLGEIVASGSPLGIALLALGAVITAYTTNFLGFRDAVNYVKDALIKLPGVLEDLIKSVGTALSNLTQVWETKWNKFKQDVDNAWSSFKNSFTQKINVAIDFVSDVSSKIREWWNDILLQIMEWIDKNTPDVLKKTLGLDFRVQIRQIKTEKYKDIGQQIGDALGEQAKSQLTKTFGKDWLADLRKAVGKDLPTTVQQISKLFKQAKINVSEETIELVAKLLLEYNKLYMELVGGSIIPDLVFETLDLFEILNASLVAGTEYTVDKIAEKWESLRPGTFLFGVGGEEKKQLQQQAQKGLQAEKKQLQQQAQKGLQAEKKQLQQQAQGTAEGGMGGVAGWILEVLAQTSSQAADALMNFAQNLIEPLSPLSIFTAIMQQLDVKAASMNSLLETLQPVINALLYPFKFLGEIVGQALIPVMKALFPVFKFLGLVVGNVMLAMLNIYNAIARVINTLLGWLGIHLGLADTKPVEEGLKKLAEMTYEEAEALANANNALDEFSDKLLNAPQGFKVALAKYQAMEPMQLTSGSTTAMSVWTSGYSEKSTEATMKSGDTITIENVYVATDDPEKFWKELQKIIERKKFVKTGSVIVEY